MKKITISIPFYNSSKYIEDAIRLPLLDSRVDEILICDDCSTDYEYNNLLNIIGEFLNGKELSFDPNYNLIPEQNNKSKKNIIHMTGMDVSEEAKKIRVIRNDKNLGGFLNKYNVVKESKNDWVYLLDSDNFLIDSSITSLYTCDWDPKVCYYPNVLIMERRDNILRQWDDWNHRRFGYELIDMKKIKELILIEEHLIQKNQCGLGVSGFLNTGNFFVNKDSYIKCFKNILGQNIETYAADVIAFSYYWLNFGNYFKIIPELYYYHRLRSDSYWSSTGNFSDQIANNYMRLFKNA